MNDAGKLFLLALGLALVVALGLAVWLIGADTLRTVALVLGGALALAVILGASALPIRAYRRRDFTGDHFHHDGTRTIVKETRVIDGRQVTAPEVKLLQLPAQQSGGAFPELLRAAYAAGALTDGRNRAGAGYPAASGAVIPDQDLAEVDLTNGNDFDGWGGDITP